MILGKSFEPYKAYKKYKHEPLHALPGMSYMVLRNKVGLFLCLANTSLFNLIYSAFGSAIANFNPSFADII
jgi:hypothetical protein